MKDYLIDEAYILISNKITSDVGIDAAYLLAVIRRIQTDQEGVYCASEGTISAAAEMSSRSVRKCISALIDAGYLMNLDNNTNKSPGRPRRYQTTPKTKEIYLQIANEIFS